jgi:hypothetical protein
MTKPPEAVAFTTCVQSRRLGELAGEDLVAALVPASLCLELHPAIAITATAPARNSLSFIDHSVP